MQQLNIFNEEIDTPPIEYHPFFLSKKEADFYYEEMMEVSWQQNAIRIMGKKIDLPRLEVMYGDSTDIKYSYSGSVELSCNLWTDSLHALKEKVEKASHSSFNIIIGNYYRTGNDYIGWHSDDEPKMGFNPVIASISLGAERNFQVRRKPKGIIHDYFLEHGSLLIMPAGFQSSYLHQLPKNNRLVIPRINLTFRPWITLEKNYERNIN